MPLGSNCKFCTEPKLPFIRSWEVVTHCFFWGDRGLIVCTVLSNDEFLHLYKLAMFLWYGSYRIFPLGTPCHFNVEMSVIFGWNVGHWGFNLYSTTQKDGQTFAEFTMCY
jgi:hypothetical protein